MSYPLYNKQMTFYVRSSERITGNNALNFSWRFPLVAGLDIDKAIIQVVQFQLTTPTILVYDNVANAPATSVCIRSDLGNLNTFTQQGNDGILVNVPTYEMASISAGNNSIYYYNNYDKTFQSTTVSNPLGKIVNFRLTDINTGNLLLFNNAGGHPEAQCLIVINMFY